MTLKGRLTDEGKVHALRDDRSPQCGVSRKAAQLVESAITCAHCLRIALNDTDLNAGDYATTPEGVTVRIVRRLPGEVIEVSYGDGRTSASYNRDRLTKVTY